MTRLTAPPKTLSTLPPRLGASAPHRNGAPAARNRAAGNRLRKLYATKRWRDLRLEMAARDGWMCRGCAVPHQLNRIKNHPASLVVNHIRPHRGNLALFWNEDNLQSVCKTWHDGEKQRLERAEAAAGGEGWA